MNVLKKARFISGIVKNEIHDIIYEPWIPKATSSDVKINIFLQCFVLLIVSLVIYWDFHQFNIQITPMYIAVKALVIGIFIISIVMTSLKKFVNLWPVLGMTTLLIYAFYGMIMIHFTYCFSFWEVYLVTSIFFKFSRKIYLLLMATGMILNLYALQLAAEPAYIRDGMSLKPDMSAGTFIVYALSVAMFFVVTKKKQALYDMQERFANIGKQSSFVFHEIKKPINRLINSSPIHDQDLKRVNNIILNVELMLSHSDVFTHNFRPVDLGRIFRELEKDFKDFFEAYNIHFEYVTHHSKVLMGNEDLLFQVLNNLMTNAIEAIVQNGTDPGKSESIKIITKDNGKKIEISFKNTGPAISHEIENKIFSPFVSTKVKESNSGLGLSFCKNIIEGHLGEIKLLNHKEGPEFIIVMP